MKKIITILLLFEGLCASAQIKMGNNPTTINSDAVLELESTTKGFLPPRMTQVQMNAIPATEGLIVYCTDCSPKGIYSNDGTSFSVLGSSANPTATITSGSGGCGALVGTYNMGVTMVGATNYKIATYTNTGPGTITASTPTLNGVSFTKTTTIYSTGAQTINLEASGMPIDGGTYTYPVTINGTAICSFTVTFMDFMSARPSVGQVADGLGGSYTTGEFLKLNSLSSSNLKVETDGYTVKLRANRTYRLTTHLKNVGAGTYVSYGFVDASAPTVPLTGTFYGGAIATAGANPVPATGFYTVGSSDVSVKLKIFNVNGAAGATNNTEGANSMLIEEVPTGRGFLCVGLQPQTLSGNLTIGATAVSTSTPASTSPVINGTTTGIKLRAGKLYRLRADLRLAGGWASYYFSNSPTGSKLTGTTYGAGFGGTAVQGNTPAAGIYQVGSSDETIYLIGYNTGGANINGADVNGQSSILVEEIPTTSEYLVATTNHGVIQTGGNMPLTLVSNSGITLSAPGTNTATINLAANKTYELIGDLRNGGNWNGLSFINSATDLVPVGIIAGGAVAPANQEPTPSTGIITTTAATTIQFRAITTSGAVTFLNNSDGQSCILVRELK